MKTKVVWAFALLLVVCALSATSGSKTSASQDDKDNNALKDAKVAYAQAVLEIAQADLARAREANGRAAETIPSTVVRGLENDVSMAKARLSAMKDGSPPDAESPYMQAAKDTLAFAEDNLQQANKVNARVPNAISKAEVDRRKADVNLAKARVQVAGLLNKATPAEMTQWELLQLQEDVHDLRFRVRLLQYRN
jgi:hypothetical protein